jgi:NAD(P)-dependent dehydrogenase (short-subunit alcohol dehydrogenase family)
MCFLLTVENRACIPQFQKQETKGVIVNVCSVASLRGAAAGVAYTASKHALLGASRSTAWMYANEGIT